MTMLPEDLEFRISQYAGGSLPAADVAALEATLAGDADARAMLADYRKLNGAIEREFTLPAIHWDRLAESISDAVDVEDERQYARSPMRIGSSLHLWARIAIAATVLLAVGSAAWLGMRPMKTPTVAINPTLTARAPQHTLLAIADITGPRAESSRQPAVEEVAIGPSKAAGSVNYAVAEDIVYRTPRVVIASSQSDRQDSSALPY